MGTRHFKSRAGYHRWLAWGHMHGAFRVRGVQEVYINGRKIKVEH